MLYSLRGDRDAGSNRSADRRRYLRAYADAWQNNQRRLLVNGFPLSQIAELRTMCPFIREFHLGSQVRTPELPYPAGNLDPAKLQAAHRLLET